MGIAESPDAQRDTLVEAQSGLNRPITRRGIDLAPDETGQFDSRVLAQPRLEGEMPGG